jgi:hypothetical protein
MLTRTHDIDSDSRCSGYGAQGVTQGRQTRGTQKPSSAWMHSSDDDGVDLSSLDLEKSGARGQPKPR